MTSVMLTTFIYIDLNQLLRMSCNIVTFQEIGFSINQTAQILGVNRHTIINRRREYGMVQHIIGLISDRDLDIETF